jgi:hypothetical protein
VYNLHVAQWHTYFVGCQEWGFSLWAHNNEPTTEGGGYGTTPQVTNHTTDTPTAGGEADGEGENGADTAGENATKGEGEKADTEDKTDKQTTENDAKSDAAKIKVPDTDQKKDERVRELESRKGKLKYQAKKSDTTDSKRAELQAEIDEIRYEIHVIKRAKQGKDADSKTDFLKN